MRLIDADELMGRLKNRYCNDCVVKGLDYQGVKCRACVVGDELDDIDDAPTVDPVKHGHWIFGNSLRGYAQCSECKCFTGSWDEYHADNYCSHCGALMMNEVSE